MEDVFRLVEDDRAYMKQYVEGPLWHSHSYNTLDIPTVNGGPSLFLHKLGDVSLTDELATLSRHLYTNGDHHTT